MIVSLEEMKQYADIMILGVYFVIVFLAYAIFEMIPINYRPILIEGILRSASWPTTASRARRAAPICET